MSLKSFDKFCERLILSEPGSQKEVFDERQNVMRSRLAIEALFMDFYTQRRGGLVPTPQEQELLQFVGEQTRHIDGGKDALERQAKALQKFALEQEAEK